VPTEVTFLGRNGWKLVAHRPARKKGITWFKLGEAVFWFTNSDRPRTSSLGSSRFDSLLSGVSKREMPLRDQKTALKGVQKAAQRLGTLSSVL